MDLECIFTLANQAVRLQFLVMERSLRAAGCTLPLQVIPFDEREFDLPKNASWFRDEVLFRWLSANRCHPTMRKYACLLAGNYHFLDTDLVVLRDPGEVVRPYSGLVASCTEWAKPEWTYTEDSARYFAARKSTWMQEVFSTGQFAIDRPLYSHESLFRVAESPEFAEACIRFPWHEQPGVNQLVLATGIPRMNLTLPPHAMESTWAGDYPGEFEHLWRSPERQPYLIHWAGPETFDEERPINRLFYQFLSRDEMAEWETLRALRRAERERARRRTAGLLRRAARVGKRVFRMGGPPP